MNRAMSYCRTLVGEVSGIPILVLSVILSILIQPSRATAVELGVTMSNQGTVSKYNYEFCLGYEFQLSTTITVTQLGRFIPSGTPNRNAMAGLWNASGTLLASTTIPADAPTEPDANGYGWQFGEIGATVLTAGTYVVGVQTFEYSSGEPTYTYSSTIVAGPGVTATHGRADWWTGSLSFPDDIVTGNGQSYFGANFKYILGDQAALTITTPKERAVYQRGEQNTAIVPIDGTISNLSNIEVIEARYLPGGAWHVLMNQSNRFSGELVVPAGGWYQIEVRARATDNDVLTTTTLDKMGVGEVFITAGQSNAANYGHPAATPQSDTVSVWNPVTELWQHAADPLPTIGLDGGGSYGSPWSRLADILSEQLAVPIAFLSCARGSSIVWQWHPDNIQYGYYNRLLTALEIAGENGVRAILWHQGESDAYAGTDATTYENRLRDIVEQSRIDAGWEIPWGIATASYIGSATEAAMAAIRSAQQSVINDENLPMVFAGPDTDLLLGETYRYNNGVHFNALGLEAHALGWDQAIRHFFFSSEWGVEMTDEGTVSTYNYEFSLGYRFQTSAVITVTDLGRYIPDGGTSTAHAEVGLWNEAGEVIVTAVIPASNTPQSDSDGHLWRFTSIPPITLAPGRYVIGVQSFLPSDDTTYTYLSTVDTASGITWLDGRADWWGGAISFPDDIVTTTAMAYFGANFKFRR